VARKARRGCSVSRAGQFVGERIHRIVHREAAERTTQPGDFLHAQGGTYPDRAMETALQRSTSPQCSEIPASGSRNDRIPSSGISKSLSFNGDSGRALTLRYGWTDNRGRVRCPSWDRIGEKSFISYDQGNSRICFHKVKPSNGPTRWK
jgi:hypothetical protein